MMGKMILVLDNKPNGCYQCPCSNVIDDKCYICEVTYKRGTNGGRVIESCPLQQVPKYKKDKDRYKDGYVIGWNDCLNKILGGEE